MAARSVNFNLGAPAVDRMRFSTQDGVKTLRAIKPEGADREAVPARQYVGAISTQEVDGAQRAVLTISSSPTVNIGGAAPKEDIQIVLTAELAARLDGQETAQQAIILNAAMEAEAPIGDQ